HTLSAAKKAAPWRRHPQAPDGSESAQVSPRPVKSRLTLRRHTRGTRRLFPDALAVRSQAARRPAGRRAETFDQGLRTLDGGEPVLHVAQPEEIFLAGLAA